MIEVRKLDANFGAEILGLDLSDGITPEDFKTVVDALYQHQLVVIRDQLPKRVNEQAYLAFGQLWGTPIPHALDHVRMPGFPEMMAVGNTDKKDLEDSHRLGAALWHTDQSYEAVPASTTILFSRIVPDIGGQTRFANTVAAYDALQEETKKRIDGYAVSHRYGAALLTEDEFMASPIITEDQDNRLPVCKHPLVLPHPVTGRKALYGIGQSCFAIDGVEDGEARRLLWDLREHATQPQFLYEHDYRVGDVTIFDTFSTMHRATPIDIADSKQADNARLLWRISVRGRPAPYRDLAA